MTTTKDLEELYELGRRPLAPGEGVWDRWAEIQTKGVMIQMLNAKPIGWQAEDDKKALERTLAYMREHGMKVSGRDIGTESP